MLVIRGRKTRRGSNRNPGDHLCLRHQRPHHGGDFSGVEHTDHAGRQHIETPAAGSRRRCPQAVIFLGAIGGMMLSGIVGLFIGAIVLALGYKLFQAWLVTGPAVNKPADAG